MLSICIPAYNYGRFLGQTIRSCLNQEEKFELVVLDNCSSDNTQDLKGQFSDDPRVKWHRNKDVLPIQQNWNRAIELSQGQLIKVLQADDYMLPGSISKLKSWHQSAPEIGIHGHLAHIVTSDGKLIRRQPTFGHQGSYFEVRGTDAARYKIRQIARFREPSCNFFLRDAWEAIGGYSSEYRFVFDIQFNTRLAAKFGGRIWLDYAVARRVHKGSDGATLSAEMGLENLKSYLEELRKMIGEDLVPADLHWSNGLVQYRVLELVAQRLRTRPSEAFDLMRKNFTGSARVSTWPIVLRLLARRVWRKEIQGKPPDEWLKSI